MPFSVLWLRLPSLFLLLMSILVIKLSTCMVFGSLVTIDTIIQAMFSSNTGARAKASGFDYNRKVERIARNAKFDLAFRIARQKKIQHVSSLIVRVGTYERKILTWIPVSSTFRWCMTCQRSSFLKDYTAVLWFA